MSKKYEVVAVTGKYKDSSGQEKNRYQNIGVVFDTPNGPRLKLEAIPIGWDGWAYLNDPKPREQDRPPPVRQQPARTDEFGDPIPF